MIYEFRTYEAIPGMLPDLSARFGSHVIGFFQKHDIGMLGFWTNEIGVSNRLVYILKFDGLGDREKKWNAFATDPDWLQLRNAGPQMVTQISNTFMRLTPYSPEPKISSAVQELRVYEAMPGKLPALHERFANHTSGFFEKYGMDQIGYWTEDVGTSNKLVYMLGYASLGDREKSWSAFSGDADWRKVVEESHRDGILVRQAHNSILRPTAYSPR